MNAKIKLKLNIIQYRVGKWGMKKLDIIILKQTSFSLKIFITLPVCTNYKWPRKVAICWYQKYRNIGILDQCIFQWKSVNIHRNKYIIHNLDCLVGKKIYSITDISKRNNVSD